MGCDIHLYLEKKNAKGIWEKMNIDERLLPDDRSYSLFSFLAGVRSYDIFAKTPQFADRGIPEDSSVPRKETDDFWIGDHSFTYATLKEIVSAPWKAADLENSYFYIFFFRVFPRICSICCLYSDDNLINIRLIMGFDN